MHGPELEGQQTNNAEGRLGLGGGLIPEHIGPEDLLQKEIAPGERQMWSGQGAEKAWFCVLVALQVQVATLWTATTRQHIVH